MHSPRGFLEPRGLFVRGQAIASTDLDLVFLRRALKLAARGRGSTAPNPAVGAVVVRDGRIVGEGWHRAAGEDHAEVVALKRAGSRARGATLYLTLEPCAHHGRTPPCTDAILAAGVRRVVASLRDPHAIVNGKGFAVLARAGVRVDVGLGAAEARELIRGYLLAHTERRPRVTWKIASTLDGATADRRGRSRWITGAEARRHGHGLRATSDAVLIGAGTARADDPRLTVRLGGRRRQPLRVVCDTRLALPLGLRLFARPLASGTAVACGRRAPLARRLRLEARGVAVWALAEKGGHVDPRALARKLVAEGCHEVLLESGGALGAAWLAAGLADRIALYTAPLLLGPGRRWSDDLPALPLARARRAHVRERRMLGRDQLTLLELA